MLLRFCWMSAVFSSTVVALASVSTDGMLWRACSFLMANPQQIDRHFVDDISPIQEELRFILEENIALGELQIDIDSAKSVRIAQSHFEEALLRWHQTMRFDAITVAESSMSDFRKSRGRYSELHQQLSDQRSRFRIWISQLRMAMLIPGLFEYTLALPGFSALIALYFLEHRIVED